MKKKEWADTSIQTNRYNNINYNNIHNHSSISNNSSIRGGNRGDIRTNSNNKNTKYISHLTSTRGRPHARLTKRMISLSLQNIGTADEELSPSSFSLNRLRRTEIFHRVDRLEHRFSDRFGPQILTKDVFRATPMRDAHESYYTPRVQYTKSKFL